VTARPPAAYGAERGSAGSGLGLSITDELVRAYGGRLSLEASPQGGLRVAIELPGT
jgi:signal transduction histidine kinase